MTEVTAGFFQECGPLRVMRGFWRSLASFLPQTGVEEGFDTEALKNQSSLYLLRVCIY